MSDDAPGPAPPPDVPPPVQPEPWKARPVVRIASHHLSTAIAIGVGLLAIGVLLVVTLLPGLLTTSDAGGEAAAGSGTGPASGRRIQATLFYVSADGDALIPVNRSVPYGATPVEQAREIVKVAIEPPPEGFQSPIPAGTTLRSVFVTSDHRAFVDLGGTIVSGHSGGTLNEALTVYAIVNAVTVNLPDITSVQILIEGRQVDSLAGHLDLRYPLGKALDWVRKAQ
jgi:hypothetical protein